MFEARPVGLELDTVNVRVEISEPGFYEVDWSLNSIPDDWEIKFKESALESINLRNQKSFSIYVDEDRIKSKMFELTINRKSISNGDNGDAEVPFEYSLLQNFPNPFNPQTLIQYSVPNQVNVRIEVFDILGRNIGVLVDEQKQAGNHRVLFNASNIASGTYFYRITAGDFIQTNKMAVVK